MQRHNNRINAELADQKGHRGLRPLVALVTPTSAPAATPSPQKASAASPAPTQSPQEAPSTSPAPAQSPQEESSTSPAPAQSPKKESEETPQKPRKIRKRTLLPRGAKNV